MTQNADYVRYRLFIYGGDHQDFDTLDACMTEARKVLDPSKALASSITIEPIDEDAERALIAQLDAEKAAQIDGSGARKFDKFDEFVAEKNEAAQIDGSGS